MQRQAKNPASKVPSATSDTVLKSRYECKYLIHPRLMEGIRNYMRPFVRPDRFAAKTPDRQYTICSLYLDTPNLDLYEATVRGDKTRFKLRVRTYADGPDQPVFFEVKKRMDGIIYKRRSALGRVDALRFLDGRRTGLPSLPQEASADLQEFSQLQDSHGAIPMMRVKYRREAYESVARDPVRITFDTDVVNALTHDLTLTLAGAGWIPTPLEDVVLEIKFTDRFPPWLGEMVKHFDLRRCSAAKYVLSMDRALAEGRCRRPVIVRRNSQPDLATKGIER